MRCLWRHPLAFKDLFAVVSTKTPSSDCATSVMPALRSKKTSSDNAESPLPSVERLVHGMDRTSQEGAISSA
jgi:hypothetical protein